MIYEGSRYENSAVVLISDVDDIVHPFVVPDPFAAVSNFDFDSHLVHQGERLDVLAADAYGDPEMWWVIARANPEVFFPDQIPEGTVLRIPYAEGVF